MELSEERAIVQRGGGYALAESGDGFRDDANLLLLFGRKEKGAQKGTMNAVSESEPGFAEAGEELIGKAGRIGEHRHQRFAPVFGGVGGHRGGDGGGGGCTFAPGGG